jgi:hypothetical protein
MMPLSEVESQKMWQKMLDALTPIFDEFTQASEKTMTQATGTQPSFTPTFPPEYEELLNKEFKNGVWIIKPRQFLGSENFAEIARIVKQYGGSYVSAGKMSRFEIPDKK